MSQLVTAYWKPVYGYLRLKWRLDRDAASDATQEFFLRAMEKSYFDWFDPSRARFRTFLRTCVDRFASKERRDAGRLKREGSAHLLSLDFAGAEARVAAVASISGNPGNNCRLCHSALRTGAGETAGLKRYLSWCFPPGSAASPGVPGSAWH